MSDLKPLVRELYAGASAGGDLEATIEKCIAEDFVDHEEPPPGMDGNGPGLVRQLFEMVHAGFPDFHVEIHDLLQDGDKVVARVDFVGTHQGDFMGVPASGNQMRMPVFDLFEFRDDKVVAHWGLMDLGALMSQIGADGAP
jgi:steroid delta-isomerase-like uncharacterized protein